MAQQQSTWDPQAFMAFIQQPEQAAQRWELHNGEAHIKLPSLLHGLIAATILAWLQRYLDAHPLGLAAVEVLHRLPDDPLNACQPDLSLYLHEQLVGANWEAPLPFLPALVIEVQSTSNTTASCAPKRITTWRMVRGPYGCSTAASAASRSTPWMSCLC